MELISLISPLIKAPEIIPPHMQHLVFFNSSMTKEKTWEILLAGGVYQQIKKSCFSELRKSAIKDLNDLIVDTCISRIEYILKHKGLPFPASGSDISYRWEGWFVLMFKNASKTALEKERKATDNESLEALQELGAPIQKDKLAASPEDTLLHQANIELSHHLSLHSYLLHGEQIKPQMRLYTLLLNDPSFVQYEHFQACFSSTNEHSNPFHRSLHDIWNLWSKSCDYLLSLKRKEEDNEVQTKARNEIIFLLFGVGYSNTDAFIFAQESKFDKLKDRIRKTINRCTYQLHKARIAYILEHIDVQKEKSLYRDLLYYDLRNGMILSRRDIDQIDIYVDELLSLTGANYNARKVGAIIHGTGNTLSKRLSNPSNAGERVAKNLSLDFKKSRKKQ